MYMNLYLANNTPEKSAHACVIIMRFTCLKYMYIILLFCHSLLCHVLYTRSKSKEINSYLVNII